ERRLDRFVEPRADILVLHERPKLVERVAYRLDVGEAYVSKLGGHRASRRLRLAVLRRDRACEGIDSLERRRIARLAHAGECLLERMRISSDLGESEHPRLALHRVELAESV